MTLRRKNENILYTRQFSEPYCATNLFKPHIIHLLKSDRIDFSQQIYDIFQVVKRFIFFEISLYIEFLCVWLS